MKSPHLFSMNGWKLGRHIRYIINQIVIPKLRKDILPLNFEVRVSVSLILLIVEKTFTVPRNLHLFNAPCDRSRAFGTFPNDSDPHHVYELICSQGHHAVRLTCVSHRNMHRDDHLLHNVLVFRDRGADLHLMLACGNNGRMTERTSVLMMAQDKFIAWLDGTNGEGIAVRKGV